MRPIAITTLIIFAAAAAGCSKGKLVSAAAQPSVLDSTHRIEGVKMMYGIQHRAEIDVYDSTLRLNDTSISFVVVNDTAIEMGGKLFSYVSDLSTDSMFYFWSVGRDSLFSEASVSYYLKQDSLVIDKLLLTTATAYVETIYYSRK